MPPPTAGEIHPAPESMTATEATALDRAIATRDALAAEMEKGITPERPKMSAETVRLIVDHRVNGLNEAIEIVVQDQPGPGGANRSYALFLRSAPSQPAERVCFIKFQDGPIGESGFNGFTNEALLAVVIDRLRGFQHGRKADGSFDFNSRGTFACRENALALTDLESALMWLQKRTRDRLARGVEGTHKL